MSHGRALERIRAFLYAMTLLLFIGTIAELLAVKHYGETLKLVPFALCVLGIVAVAVAWFSARPPVLLAIRAFMVVTMAGSVLGVYEHLQGNLATSKEIHRHATTMQRIEQTLQGRDPIAAPGMLAIGALLLIAATYVTASLGAPSRQSDVRNSLKIEKPTPFRSSRTA